MGAPPCELGPGASLKDYYDLTVMRITTPLGRDGQDSRELTNGLSKIFQSHLWLQESESKLEIKVGLRAYTFGISTSKFDDHFVSALGVFIDMRWRWLSWLSRAFERLFHRNDRRVPESWFDIQQLDAMARRTIKRSDL
jgi:hypothetical protein